MQTNIVIMVRYIISMENKHLIGKLQHINKNIALTNVAEEGQCPDAYTYMCKECMVKFTLFFILSNVNYQINYSCYGRKKIHITFTKRLKQNGYIRRLLARENSCNNI